MLEGGEERVQLGERGAVDGFQGLDGGDAANELTLQIKWWEWHLELFDPKERQLADGHLPYVRTNLALCERSLKQRGEIPRIVNTADARHEFGSVLSQVRSVE